MKTNSFKDLVVWQKSHNLTLQVYKITKNFPIDEKFGLISQMRRAAYSIPANIVEGHSRKSKKEFIQLLSIVKGSLEELKYFIILSSDLNYINDQTKISLEEISEEVSKVLYSFTKAVQKSDR